MSRSWTMTRGAIAACLFLAGQVLGVAAQERQWQFDAGDEDAYLLFGVPDSDDIGISFWCKMKSGEVNVLLPEGDPDVPENRDVTLVLAAGSARAELSGRTEVNLEAGTTSVEARLAATDAILAAMAAADRFHAILGAEDLVFPLYEADVTGFLSLCRKP